MKQVEKYFLAPMLVVFGVYSVFHFAPAKKNGVVRLGGVVADAALTLAIVLFCFFGVWPFVETFNLIPVIEAHQFPINEFEDGLKVAGYFLACRAFFSTIGIVQGCCAKYFPDVDISEFAEKGQAGDRDTKINEPFLFRDDADMGRIDTSTSAVPDHLLD